MPAQVLEEDVEPERVVAGPALADGEAAALQPVVHADAAEERLARRRVGLLRLLRLALLSKQK